MPISFDAHQTPINLQIICQLEGYLNTGKVEWAIALFIAF